MKSLLAGSCRAHACTAFMSLLLSSAIAADVGEPVGELTLARAIDATRQRNPALAVTSYELKVREARVTQAERLPNPQLSLEFEDFAGSGAYRGMDSLEATLSLSQTIELGGKRAYRTAVANMDLQLSGTQRQAQQLDVLAEVTRRFIDVVLAQEEVSLARRATALNEQSLSAITARVEAARSPQAEQSRATIALTRARIQQQQAEGKLQSKRRALAALWGSHAASFTYATADLFALPSVRSLDELNSALRANPDFLRFATEERLRDAEIRLAQTQAKSDLNLSFGVRRYEATNDTAFVAGVSIPLPVFNRNQGATREAEVRREQLRVQSQAALLQAEAVLFGIYQELVSARMRVTTLRADAIPQAEAALTQTQFGYERGRFSYLELSAAQQELLGLQAAAIEAGADYHRLVAEIERLTGEPLTTDYLEAPTK